MSRSRDAHALDTSRASTRATPEAPKRLRPAAYRPTNADRARRARAVATDPRTLYRPPAPGVAGVGASDGVVASASGLAWIWTKPPGGIAAPGAGTAPEATCGAATGAAGAGETATGATAAGAGATRGATGTGASNNRARLSMIIASACVAAFSAATSGGIVRSEMFDRIAAANRAQASASSGVMRNADAPRGAWLCSTGDQPMPQSLPPPPRPAQGRPRLPPRLPGLRRSCTLVPVVLTRPTFEIIEKAADAAGVPLHVALALAHVESGFNPRATSPVGAQGLFQLMPGTARGLGVTDPYDPAQSARGGLEFLAAQIAKRRGNLESALAAYNWGPGNVARKPKPEQWPPSVQRYVGRVLERAGAYKEAIARLPFVLTPPRGPRPSRRRPTGRA